MEVYLYIYSSPHISVRRKSCQRKSSFPQLTLLHLFSEKLRGMVEAPNFISEKNISYCLQRVIQLQVKQDLTKPAEKLQEVSELGKTRHPWGISQIFSQFSDLPQQGALPAELQVEQVERKECDNIVP